MRENSDHFFLPLSLLPWASHCHLLPGFPAFAHSPFSAGGQRILVGPRLDEGLLCPELSMAPTSLRRKPKST